MDQEATMNEQAFEQHQWVTLVLSAFLCAAIVAVAVPWPL